jgi:hypothetical protein
VASSDQQVRQLYTITNEELADLVRGFVWQELLSQYTFLTTAAEVQIGARPVDWLSFIADSMWNRSQSRMVWGPMSPQDWQMIMANGPVGVIDSYFRLRGNDFLITPTPAAGETIAYEYVSINGVLTNLGVPQEAYTADDDVARISERLITLGVRWRFKAAKGLDYAEDLQTYEREKGVMQAKNKGLQTLSLARPSWGLHGPYVPEGSWPP